MAQYSQDALVAALNKWRSQQQGGAQNQSMNIQNRGGFNASSGAPPSIGLPGGGGPPGGANPDWSNPGQGGGGGYINGVPTGYEQIQIPRNKDGTPAEPNMQNWRDKSYQDAMMTQLNYYLPQNQLAQNAYQYGADLGQRQTEFNSTFGQQQKNDAFGQQLANKQFGLSDWAAKEQANQFGKQLGFEQLQNTQQYGLQRDQFGQAKLQNQQQYGLQQGQAALNSELGRGNLAVSKGELALSGELGRGNLGVAQGNLGLQRELGTGELALKKGQQGLDENWRKTQADLTRSDQANQLTQSRYAAFGRAQAPQSKMMRNW